MVMNMLMGVDLPNSKYYNVYRSASPNNQDYPTAQVDKACDGSICYGHSLSETYGASS